MTWASKASTPAASAASSGFAASAGRRPAAFASSPSSPSPLSRRAAVAATAPSPFRAFSDRAERKKPRRSSTTFRVAGEGLASAAGPDTCFRKTASSSDGRSDFFPATAGRISPSSNR